MIQAISDVSGSELCAVISAGLAQAGILKWQVIGTYNWQMCIFEGLNVDGYIGYRTPCQSTTRKALERPGTKYDVLQQGACQPPRTSFFPSPL